MASRASRTFLAFFLVILLPLSFFIFFEIKKHRTGVQIEPLPVLSVTPSPDFSFSTHTGGILTRDSLHNKIVVADFIFTRCRGICPLMTNRMKRVQRWLKKNKNIQSQILLISHTVDPQNDSIEVLKEYAEKYDADKDLWLFVTGQKNELQNLMIDFYKLPLLATPEDTLSPITHSERFVLLDKSGFIRGYYDGTNDESVQQLQKNIVELDLLYKMENRK